MGNLIGYMRVSTADQNTDGQLDALVAAGVRNDPKHLFTDHGVSGAKAERPGLARCLDALRDGDVLVVAKLDRLGRSLGNLIALVEQLKERGVGFRVLDNPMLNTETKEGKLMFSFFGALAEFERDLIRERTHTGLAAARARGRNGGRPALLDSAKISRAKELHAAGNMSPKEVADAVGVSVATLYRYLAKDTGK